MSSPQPHYARLGFFVLLAGALIVGALIWFGGLRGNRDEILVETWFRDPVSGLDTGSPVNFRGVKVGEVRRISFIGSEYEEHSLADAGVIWVQLALDCRRMGRRVALNGEHFIRSAIGRGVRATVSPTGITGLSRIELDFPRGKVPDYPISWKPATPCIPPAPSILQSAADSAQRILDQIDRMDLVDAWTNLVTVIRAAGGTLDNTHTLLESQRGNIGEILANLRETSESLRQFSAQIRENPSLLLRDHAPQPLDETR